MNTPNPLIPQGSLPSRGKSTVRIAFFTIAAIHVVFIGGLLMQGCKKPENKTETTETNTTQIPPFVETSNVPPPVVSNTPPTNPVVEPAPRVEVPLPPVPETKEYVVTKGDSFSSIGKKYGVSWKAIEQANPGVSSSKLKIGQKIQIPAASASVSSGSAAISATTSNGDTTTYVVRAGDMLERIARTHGTTAKTIMSLNGLKTTTIKPGQKLKLPATKGASSEPVASPNYVTPLPPTGASATKNP